VHHVGVGRAHAGTRNLILAHDRHVRIINRDTGDLLGDLVLAPRGLPITAHNVNDVAGHL
jgi:hypothetical protein